jgi:hypothetical protein
MVRRYMHDPMVCLCYFFFVICFFCYYFGHGARVANVLARCDVQVVGIFNKWAWKKEEGKQIAVWKTMISGAIAGAMGTAQFLFFLLFDSQSHRTRTHAPTTAHAHRPMSQLSAGRDQDAADGAKDRTGPAAQVPRRHGHHRHHLQGRR